MKWKNDLQKKVNEYGNNLDKMNTKELLIHLALELFISEGCPEGQLKRSKK